MAPGQEADNENLGKTFRFSTQKLYGECTHFNRLDDVILMNTHNLRLYDKSKKISLNICFLGLSEEFVGTQKRVRISDGKRAIYVRATEVRL